MLAPLHQKIETQVAYVEAIGLYQIPGLHIVGLPSKEVLESRERIRAALISSGIGFPKKKIIVSLVPASLPKSGTLLDLPMALEILRVEQGLELPTAFLAWGELGLNGEIRSVGYRLRNILTAMECGAEYVLAPLEDQKCVEKILAELGSSIKIYFCANLKQAFEAIQDLGQFKKIPKKEPIQKEIDFTLSVSLSAFCKRMLLLMMAGEHHAVILGPKGTGKSTLGSWVENLRPLMPQSLLLQKQKMDELLDPWAEGLEFRVPFLRCSTSIRPQSLLGGVQSGLLKPGLLSQAHGGYLFADEFLEWHRDSRECLRESLERRRLTLSLVKLHVELPSDFTLIAVANECPCGNEKSACVCPPGMRTRYLNGLSGPVLDRIDLAFVMGPQKKQMSVLLSELFQKVETLKSSLIKKYGQLPGKLNAVQVETLLHTRNEWTQSLKDFESLRARHKTFRLALTLAEIDQSEVQDSHFAEAKRLRPDTVVRGLQDPFDMPIYEDSAASVVARNLRPRQWPGRPSTPANLEVLPDPGGSAS